MVRLRDRVQTRRLPHIKIASLCVSCAWKQQLEKLLSSIHRKLGSVKSTSNENWNVSTFNLTTRIVMIQNTIFEQGTATEKFTFVITDTDALLLGYNINSNDLIEK